MKYSLCAAVLAGLALQGDAQKGKNKASGGALTARMGKYPGYTGGLTPDGSVTVRFNPDNTMLITLNVDGLEEDETGGVHIHSGTTCDDANSVGGHYWDESIFGAGSSNDPWNTWNSNAGTQYSTHGTVTDTAIAAFDNGYGFDDNNERAVVMHASDGTRIACGVLVPEFESVVAEIGTYPGYTGNVEVSGKVTVEFLQDRSIDFQYDIKGVADDSTGGIHIHTGTTCDDANDVGGHWWSGVRVADLWVTAAGAVYNANGKGKAKGSYVLANGHSPGAYEGRAVVVHEAGSGTRVGCGVLVPKSMKKGKAGKLSQEAVFNLNNTNAAVIASGGAVVLVAAAAFFAVKKLRNQAPKVEQDPLLA